MISFQNCYRKFEVSTVPIDAYVTPMDYEIAVIVYIIWVFSNISNSTDDSCKQIHLRLYYCLIAQHIYVTPNERNSTLP